MISNNASGGYGGLFLDGAVTMQNSIITHNKTLTYAGGFRMTGGTLVSNCMVTANISSNSSAGGIEIDGRNGTNVLANCTIAGNVAQTGGGGLNVYTAGSGYPQLVQNCLIYGNTNTTDNGGGGVYLEGIGQYPYGLINCTIANNQSANLGGGIRTAGTTNYIANCVIYGNISTGDDYDEVYNTIASGTNNFWYNCIPTNLVAGQGNITNNPLFIDAGNRNYRLSSGSPCANTGTNMSWMTNSVDLDGRMRIRYGTVDMGAYEVIYSGTIFSIH